VTDVALLSAYKFYLKFARAKRRTSFGRRERRDCLARPRNRQGFTEVNMALSNDRYGQFRTPA
jgi:hypothetical protein